MVVFECYEDWSIVKVGLSRERIEEGISMMVVVGLEKSYVSGYEVGRRGVDRARLKHHGRSSHALRPLFKVHV